MPEKSLTIAAYAAGASLAAATLVYVFGPTFFLDEVDASQNDRKRVAIGLRNDANDCFVNSTLQALAGLPKLRLYLIHELHLRDKYGKEVYHNVTLSEATDEKSKAWNKKVEWLRLSLQTGVLTAATKEMLDALNERPLSRKTISPQQFIGAVEVAFRTRVSRYQQDAQEFMQLVLERLTDEHQAGVRARSRAGIAEAEAVSKSHSITPSHDAVEDPAALANDGFNLGLPERATSDEAATMHEQPEPPIERQATQESVFPLEGKISSQIECTFCHFKPKSADTTFVTLTLNVPHHTSSTSLDACLDGILKMEHIDDFRCDRCRLVHALEQVEKRLARPSLGTADKQELQSQQALIRTAIETDPEHPPKELKLPEASTAPQRRIARHMRISHFPQVLAIHLSRSVWDGYATSSKNTAKVSFPEKLQLGGLLDRKTFRLMSLITHKGGHNSGHYETFRRQWLTPTFDQANTTKLAESDTPRPSMSDDKTVKEDRDALKASQLDAEQLRPSTPTLRSSLTASPMLKATSQAKLAERKRKAQDRWWRISDEKVKECKVTEVLAMQKEVYLLFYELVTA